MNSPTELSTTTTDTSWRYPFELINAFFVCVNVQRVPEIKANTNSEFHIQIKTVFDKYPELIQVNLRTQPKEDAQIKISLELAGMFKYSGGNPEADRPQFKEFLANQGFLMLWQYMVQMIRSLAPQMGIEGVSIPLHPSVVISKLW